MNGVSYTGIGGAAGFITGATLAPGSPSAYQYSATYDLLSRATDLKVSLLQSVLFEQTRSFDAAGNVSTANTTLSTGTDHQAFCYDEQNRLTAAASSGTVPCQTFSPGTLSAANYNQRFSYDTMGRLASGPAGAYVYGDPAHVHAATAIGSTYTAAYDAAGDMSCRAPTSSSTCTGTQTGAQLTYNTEGQLSNWQNQPSNPTSTASFLYDGQGKRVAQQTTVGGSTTTTVYVGDLEEDATTGGTTSKTSYYYAGGWRFAVAVNGAVSYLASDGLGSANVTLSANGNVTAAVLYAPYGSVRYMTGSMPTDHGFTGQIADATSGLDYYGARYYDPLASQFTSADTMLEGSGFDVWGLSRYAYVRGNPTLRTDPTGHCYTTQCWIDVNDPNSGRVSQNENLKGGQAIVTRSINDAYQYARTHPDGTRPGPMPIPSYANAVNPPGPRPGNVNDLPSDTSTFNFWDPSQSPGPNWHLDPRYGRNWVDDQDWSLSPDLNHGGGKGPHWDVHPPTGGKGTLRPDGTIVWATDTSAQGATGTYWPVSLLLLPAAVIAVVILIVAGSFGGSARFGHSYSYS